MIETTDAATLRHLHVIMQGFILDITPAINEKMNRNLDLNVQKPDVIRLARAYVEEPQKECGSSWSVKK